MTWEKQIQGGISAIERSEYAAAEQALKNALQFAKEKFSRSDDRLALTVSLLGHFYFSHKEFGRAERLLESSLRLHSHSPRFTDPCYIMDLYAVVEIKASRGEYLHSCRLLRDHLAVMRKAEAVDWIILDHAIEQFTELLSSRLDQLSDRDRLKYEGSPTEPDDDQDESNADGEASSNSGANSGANSSSNSDEHADPTLGHDGAEIAAVVGAQVSTTSGGAPRSASASSSGSHSMLDVWKQQLNTGLEGLSLDDDEKETWVSAYLNIESAVRLAYRLFKPGEQNLTITLAAFAEASAKLKMFEQAETLYKEAMELTKLSEDESGPGDFYAIQLQFVVFYSQFEQFKQAKALLEEWGSTDEAMKSPIARDLSSRLNKARECIKVFDAVQDLIAQAGQSEEQNDFEKAARLANHALLQLRNGFPPNHPEQSRVLRYRARLLRSLGNIEQADELSQRAERIERANDQAFAELLRLTDDLPKAELPVSV